MTRGVDRPAPASQVLAAVQHLRALTEQQVAAARSLHSEELAALNDRRADALFALKVALADNGFTDSDPKLRDEVRLLQAAERRLALIATTVLERVSRLDRASPAPIYDRTGRMG